MMSMLLSVTEKQLLREISGLNQRIDAHKPTDPRDRAAKCARAFLRQLLHDRVDLLKLLRNRKRRARN